MPTRRRLPALLAAFWMMLGALGWAQVTTAPPAHACSCRPLTTSELMDAADLIADVTVLEVAYQGPGRTQARHVLGVERVWKGEHLPEVTMDANVEGPACGLGRREVGSTFTLWGYGGAGHYGANWCFLPAQPVEDQDLRDRFGDPWTPPSPPQRRPAPRSTRPDPAVVAGVTALVGFSALAVAAWVVTHPPRRRP
ncbi:hypothetical protein G7070_08805 [Propioniciclava coleopterorum]|uniref:Tissue inhibitor of metalloproteinase n=1 Tax=Propioniciclava coleopterorum TaxID=2714937 RepID=A0A6G7Y6E3_9ACTN|nr:hypothetical protein [Propioniciclava coleopterorum]QIK72353.1 hypothetical protein G7070_08805 [Propioniciclava coleopterorum]